MESKNSLRIIREQLGLQLSDVADFASISLPRLENFESGQIRPSRKQMERLADTYGVPVYALYSDKLPPTSPLPVDFRKSDPRPAALSPKGLQVFFASEKIAKFTKQLAKVVGYKPLDLAVSARKANSSNRRASELRAAFDEWFAKRSTSLKLSGSNEQQFMGALRLFFEIQGGVLQINDAPPSDYLGFYTYKEEKFPTIFVNRSISSKKAQLFTLAHEYCHALMDLEGVSNPFNARNKIERNCNIFAAEFLAPIENFTRTVESLPAGVRRDAASLIEATSRATLLSKHAAAIRLVETEYLVQQQLVTWRRIFTRNPKEEKEEEKLVSPRAGGGAPHAKRLSEIGQLPVYLACKAMEAKFIDSYDVEVGLGLSANLQEKAFSLVTKRFKAALS
ncbi:helix-turn-helix domain-containing protein [Labrys okinawensis]|nr:ImmA/IrrE family metallo-endopeptidase [Labrys okinawensis]